MKARDFVVYGFSDGNADEEGRYALSSRWFTTSYRAARRRSARTGWLIVAFQVDGDSIGASGPAHSEEFDDGGTTTTA
jgi:hypothetical protein